MIGLVVNDSIVAAIVGSSFTACLALMAWIVKGLLTLNGRVDVIEKIIGPPVRNGRLRDEDARSR